MSTIKQLRSLMPQRRLTAHEALVIAERQAMRLRQLSGITDEPFAGREVIAGLPKVAVVYDEALPQSGSTHWTGRVWQITINANEPFTRQRYTLAHEFKHVLDAPFDALCYPLAPNTSTAAFAETVCDYFAATLLMPKLMVRQAFTSGHLQDPAELAQLFGVSVRAMEVRLQSLGLTERKYRCRRDDDANLARPRRFYRSARPRWEHLLSQPVLGGV